MDKSTPGRNRTPNQLIKSQLLYLVELPAHVCQKMAAKITVSIVEWQINPEVSKEIRIIRAFFSLKQLRESDKFSWGHLRDMNIRG